jgi:hypothetical protein
MKETKNIKFCAFLRYKRIHPDAVMKIERGRAVYQYALPDEDWIKLKQEFNKSCFIEYANCLEAIKDLAY